MFEEIAVNRLLIQERLDRAAEARLAAGVRPRRRHQVADRLRRFADRLDS